MFSTQVFSFSLTLVFIQKNGQALFRAFSASILSIEGRPKRCVHVFWHQVADDIDWGSTWRRNLSEALSCTYNVCPKLGDQSICKASIKTSCSICTHMLLHVFVFRLASLRWRVSNDTCVQSCAHNLRPQRWPMGTIQSCFFHDISKRTLETVHFKNSFSSG